MRGILQLLPGPSTGFCNCFWVVLMMSQLTTPPVRAFVPLHSSAQVVSGYTRDSTHPQSDTAFQINACAVQLSS